MKYYWNPIVEKLYSKLIDILVDIKNDIYSAAYALEYDTTVSDITKDWYGSDMSGEYVHLCGMIQMFKCSMDHRNIMLAKQITKDLSGNVDEDEPIKEMTPEDRDKFIERLIAYPEDRDEFIELMKGRPEDKSVKETMMTSKDIDEVIKRFFVTSDDKDQLIEMIRIPRRKMCISPNNRDELAEILSMRSEDRIELARSPFDVYNINKLYKCVKKTEDILKEFRDEFPKIDIYMPKQVPSYPGNPLATDLKSLLEKFEETLKLKNDELTTKILDVAYYFPDNRRLMEKTIQKHNEKIFDGETIIHRIRQCMFVEKPIADLTKEKESIENDIHNYCN